MRLNETKTVIFDGKPTLYFRELETDISKGGKLHITQRGDRLDLLAYMYYGDCEKFYIIQEANLDIIKNPLEEIPPGQHILIPNLR